VNVSVTAPALAGESPTPRIAWLDALRGFALLGILLANLPLLAGYPFLAAEARAALPFAAFAPVWDALAGVLIEGKFYALFSFLFGLGVALQLRRARTGGADPVRAHRRRMKVLLGIGLAHAWLLWWGDILWLYALLGFALLAFRQLSQRALLRAALAVLAAPVALYLLFLAIAMPDPFAPAPGAPPGEPLVLRLTRAFADGSYSEVVRSNLTMSAGGALRRLMRFQALRVFGLFLLGAWFAGLDLHTRRDALRPLLRRWLALAFFAGLPLAAAYVALGGGDALLPATARGLLAVVAGSIAIPLLALGYVAAFGLWWRRAPERSLLVAGGRTALSQYLLQSLLGVALFYGIGAGLWGRLGRVELLLLALGLFALQLVLARAWLRHHAQGPIEAVWRRLARVPAAA
jgi:uncharacterized protein